MSCLFKYRLLVQFYNGMVIFVSLTPHGKELLNFWSDHSSDTAMTTELPYSFNEPT